MCEEKPEQRINVKFLVKLKKKNSDYSGYINSQNYRIWSTNNPNVFQPTSLHEQKVGVWCVILKYHVIGPIFHEQTVNSEEYKHILTDFIALLDDTREQKSWFQ